MRLTRLCRLTFRLQQGQPHEAAFVIDKQEKDTVTAWGRRLDGPADIAVYKLQRLIGSVGCAPLFVDEAPVA